MAFALAAGEDVIKLTNAPNGCAAKVTRPKPLDAAQQQGLSEAFFKALGTDYGASQSEKVIVACP